MVCARPHGYHLGSSARAWYVVRRFVQIQLNFVENLLRSIFLSLLIAAAVVFPVSILAQPIDQVPMYGGMNRATVEQLREADEKLIAETVMRFGSREKASAMFVSNGFAYYGRDDLTNAMRRFNQAWLLDPNNPEVYWGFATVLHDQGKNCESMKLFEKAYSFGRYVEGMNPDAGRIFTLCALDDKTLTDDARNALYKRSDELYSESLSKDSNKGYVYASLATTRYWRGQYAEAWAAVKQARAKGSQLPEQFLKLLRNKMPEPAQ
jgi:Tfp pilus assembly protein PilF